MEPGGLWTGVSNREVVLFGYTWEDRRLPHEERLEALWVNRDVEALWSNAFFLHVFGLDFTFHQIRYRDFEGVQTSPCEFFKK